MPHEPREGVIEAHVSDMRFEMRGRVQRKVAGVGGAVANELQGL